jgi:hypothetical protein
MVPALTAALVGVLLGALVVVVGVLAGQRGGCCCNCYGPVCAQSVGSIGPYDQNRTPGRPVIPWHPPVAPPWIRPELQRHDVPEPATLMLVALGAALIWRMS